MANRKPISPLRRPRPTVPTTASSPMPTPHLHQPSLPADDPPPPCSIFPNDDRRRRPTRADRDPPTLQPSIRRPPPQPITLSRSVHHEPINPSSPARSGHQRMTIRPTHRTTPPCSISSDAQAHHPPHPVSLHRTAAHEHSHDPTSITPITWASRPSAPPCDATSSPPNSIFLSQHIPPQKQPATPPIKRKERSKGMKPWQTTHQSSSVFRFDPTPKFQLQILPLCKHFKIINGRQPKPKNEAKWARSRKQAVIEYFKPQIHL